MKKLKLKLDNKLTKEQMKKISGGYSWTCYGPHPDCNTGGTMLVCLEYTAVDGGYLTRCGYCCIA